MKVNSSPTALFGTDGIRARAGQGPLAADALRALGRAIGTMLRDDPRALHPRLGTAVMRALALRRRTGSGHVVVLGRDTRGSGPAIERALLREMGARAIRVGVVPTPGIAYLTRRWGADLGIVISASHNPARDNGIKVLSAEGFKIPDAAERRLEALLASPERRTLPRAASVRRRPDEYVDFLRAQLPAGRPLRGMKVVVDCAHGATSPYAARLLRSAGAEPIVLNARPNGTNINAGAGALFPERLATAVRRARADLGAAYDGDGDRCILVDETGEVRDGDYILAVCAEAMIRDRTLRGRTVVSTVMANLGLEKFLRERGARLRRVKVGDKFVAEEMMRTGATLGGEQSGHIIFLDAATSGDGMLTTLRILRILLERGRPLSALCAGLRKAPQILMNVPVRAKPDLDSVAPVRRALEEMRRDLDGDGRVLLRYSGTEPLCRVMVEGLDEDKVRRTVRRLAEVVRRALAPAGEA
ncbi:MAG: phosphoglucosamine mutase [Planctomycetes bacterium]|nr:phosphoglucosamine mutase [Planctomycetota bacterium]